MHEIHLLGLNHKTADVELRECLAFSEDETGDALKEMGSLPAVEEMLLLSTCNRVEVLFTTKAPELAVRSVMEGIARCKKLPCDEFAGALYHVTAKDAVRHIFRVAASLDSLVVGEPQILGQIKEAYRKSVESGTSGVIINRLLHKTFSLAKRVRTETGIGGHAVSISYAAVELSKKIFGSLEDKEALLIGAGEMAELAVEHLIQNRIRKVHVANRTFERAMELASRFSGQALTMEEILTALTRVDIIISSTGAKGFILTKDQVKSVLRQRKNRPMFFIDIAVPRDIDPAINRLSNTYVYDVDDLKSVVAENIQDRYREARKAERIVEESVVRFMQWYESLNVVPTIVSLRSKFGCIAEQEVNRTFQALSHLSDKDREAILRMTDAMINKILHDPTVFLKTNGHNKKKSHYLDAARKLFNLDP